MNQRALAPRAAEFIADHSSNDTRLETFRCVLADYIVDRISWPDARRWAVASLDGSHDRAVSMLYYLRSAESYGLLTETEVSELGEAISRALSSDPELINPAAEDLDRVVTVGPGTELCGRYIIRQPIGSGGIGDVFLGVDRHKAALGRDEALVAIKVVRECFRANKDAIRSLQREAVNAQCLVHPNIRRVDGSNRHAGVFFIVMEWLNGETLGTRLDRTAGRSMPWDGFATILAGCGEGLSFAHTHGIVHGDVKPGNVFVTTAGDIKLLDFGHVETLSRSSDRPSPESFAITHGYSSPEAHRGEAPTVRDDVYSLAAMAYRILVGRRVFGRYSSESAQQKGLLARRPPGLLSDVQWEALSAGLEFERANRPESISALVTPLLSESVEPCLRSPAPVFIAA